MDVCMKEALGCRHGLQLAVQHGERRVVLETDCLELINLWQKRNVQRSAIGPVLEEINALSLAFHSFSFSYVNRSSNKIAHVLAKQVSKTHRTEMWHVTSACAEDLLVSEASAT